MWWKVLYIADLFCFHGSIRPGNITISLFFGALKLIFDFFVFSVKISRLYYIASYKLNFQNWQHWKCLILLCDISLSDKFHSSMFYLRNLSQFSLYVHKDGLEPQFSISFHLYVRNMYNFDVFTSIRGLSKQQYATLLYQLKSNFNVGSMLNQHWNLISVDKSISRTCC